MHMALAELAGAVCYLLLQNGPALALLVTVYLTAGLHLSGLEGSKVVSTLTRSVPRRAQVVKSLTIREATLARQAVHKLPHMIPQGSRAADQQTWA